MLSDPYSRKLKIRSEDGVHRLKVVDGKGSDKTQGFGGSQPYVYLDYSDIASEQQRQPVVINALHYVGQSNEPVGVSWKFYDVGNKHDAEVARASDAESKLDAKVELYHATDSKSIADYKASNDAMLNGVWATLVTEVADRKTDTVNLEAKLNVETSIRSAADTVHTNAIASTNNELSAEVKERKSEVVRLDARISSETSARQADALSEAQLRESADAKLQASLDALSLTSAGSVNVEKARAEAVEAGLQNQITALLSNTDAVALNSLAELVSQYSQYNTSLVYRVSQLEAVLADLVEKSF
jgi:hypothetical protein